MVEHATDPGRNALREAWDAAADGGPIVAVVRGPDGAGKSALLDSLAADPALAGAAVRAGASPLEADDTLALARRVLVGLLGGGAPADDAALRRAIGGLDPALADSALACGALAAILSGDPAGELADLTPAARGVLAGRHLAALAVARSRQAPLALLLDDAHWADDASAQCLAALYGTLRTAGRLPLLLAVAFRPGTKPLPLPAPGLATREIQLAGPEATGRREPDGRWADEAIPPEMASRADLTPAVAARVHAARREAPAAAERHAFAGYRSLAFGAVHEAARHAQAARHWQGRVEGETPADLGVRLAALESGVAFALAAGRFAVQAAPDAHPRGGDLDEARAALAGAEAARDRPAMAQQLLRLGQALEDAGEHPDARAAYEKGLDLAARIGDLPRTAALGTSLGTLAARSCDTSLARKAFEGALAACREAGDRLAEGTVLLRLARAMRELGAAEAAEGDYLDAVMALEEAGAKPSLAAAYRELGRLKVDVERYREAVELFHRSAALAGELGDLAAQGSDQRAIAESHASLDRQPEALSWGQRSLETLERSGDALEVGRTFAFLAKVHAESGQLEEAQAFAREARMVFGHLGAADELDRFNRLADILLVGRR